MDLSAPISSIMTRKLVTAVPNDRLTHIKEIFKNSRIHHIPVVKYTTLVGLISRVDFNHFVNGVGHAEVDQLVEQGRLNSYTAEEIMTTKLATLESTDRVNVAVEIFAENLFHAIPIVDDGELVGILTTFDLIKALQAEDTIRIKNQ